MIKTRLMTIDDLDEILEIEKRSFDKPWGRDGFLFELNENLLAKYLVAEYQDRLVGYAGIWALLGEGHITNIAVDPDYRSRGIGRELVQALIDYAKLIGLKALTLEVRVNNQVALDLYKSFGFTIEGVRPKYYDNKDDGYIMWKKLGGSYDYTGDRN